jgi:hypothetical protein
LTPDKSYKNQPPKQRHTSWHIFERLRAEYGYTCGYTTIDSDLPACENTKRLRVKE